MIVIFPAAKDIKVGDLIALTKDNEFIGYGKITTVLVDSILVDVDYEASKALKEMMDKGISYGTEFA